MEIYLYSKTSLGYGRDVLEDAVEEFLGEDGEVTGVGSGADGWNLDLEVHDKPTRSWIDGLRAFLLSRGVAAEAVLVVGQESLRVGRSSSKSAEADLAGRFLCGEYFTDFREGNWREAEQLWLV